MTLDDLDAMEKAEALGTDAQLDEARTALRAAQAHVGRARADNQAHAIEMLTAERDALRDVVRCADELRARARIDYGIAVECRLCGSTTGVHALVYEIATRTNGGCTCPCATYDAARAKVATASDTPPHPTTFSPGDPNFGRTCARCGFAVPQGCRYVHADWCDARAKVTP